MRTITRFEARSGGGFSGSESFGVAPAVLLILVASVAGVGFLWGTSSGLSLSQHLPPIRGTTTSLLSLNPSPVRSFSNCSISSPGSGFAAYDAADNETYVTDGPSIAILNQTCNVAGYVGLPTGAFSQDIAYNPSNGKVYVSDGTSDSVWVINGTKIVGVITGILDAYTIRYDPAVGGMAVRSWSSYSNSSSNLTLIVDTNVTLTTSGIPRGWPMSYSPVGGGVLVLPYRASHCFFFHCYPSFRVAVVNASTGSVVKKITLPAAGGYSAYNPVDGYTYVCTGTSVTAINLTAGVVVGNKSLGFGCSNLVYSPVKRALYVVSGTSNQVDVARSLALVHQFRVAGASGFFGIGYDSATANLYLTTGRAATVYVIPT